MKYAFIINPASGNGKGASKVIEEIKRLQQSDSRQISYYLTEGEGDACVIAARLALEAEDNNEEITIYACGGDGTVNEVANGIIDCENAVLGVVPVGSGNDFVRNFDGADFTDVEAQLNAEVELVDAIRFTYDTEAGPVDKYCVNSMNIGFDGNVAILANQLKKHRAVTGSFSYLMAIAVGLFKMKGAMIRVTADGKEVHNGHAIMCSAANGRFCGGGIESCPNALIANGLIEMLVVSEISRMTFLKVFPKFKVGKIAEIPWVNEIATFGQPRRMTVEPLEGEMQFVVDGEGYTTGKLDIEIVEKALRVAVPRARG